MTNGDFAFFMFYSHPTSYIVKPWNFYIDDQSDLSRRRTAYYAVKEVRAKCCKRIIGDPSLLDLFVCDPLFGIK